jgi:small subunit ribosomal protein S17
MGKVTETGNQKMEEVEELNFNTSEVVEINEVPAVEEPVKEVHTISGETRTEKKEEEVAPVRKSHKRILQGKVFSNKADKTIVVKIERQVAHPLYKKYYKKTKKIMAHDEKNECNIGDTVRVRECRPLSRKKRWELVSIIEKAK